MVEWMGRNSDVFPGFQKIPCYALYCVIQCISFNFIGWNLSKKQKALEFVTNTERIPKPYVFFLSRSDFYKNTNKNSVAILEKFLKQPALIIVHIIDAGTPEQARPARPRSGLDF